jgi:hypothetical protein
MNNVQLQNMVLGDAGRIVEAISTGAAWEVWMQVELVIILRANGKQAAREVPYPPPNALLRLDCLSQDQAGQYAIELKVESATSAGAAIINGINTDRAKIALYPALNPGARWVLAIGYSVPALQAMQQYAAVVPNNSIYLNQNGLGILVATV